MNDQDKMHQLDEILSHIWMVRTFIKHCEEAEEDDELRAVARDLYDFALALGAPLAENDGTKYVKLANKKWKKLREATELFLEIQPEISSHTNFKMAALSLKLAVAHVGKMLEKEFEFESTAEA